MTPPIIAAAAAAGLLTAGWVRAQAFIHSVPAHQPWRATCPHCQHTVITTRHAWAWLPRSHCPRCQRRIGPPTGTVETVTATVAALLAWAINDPLALPVVLIFAFTGTALSLVDLAVHRLPDRLTFTALTVTTLLPVEAVWHQHGGDSVSALAGAATSAGFYLLLAVHAGGGAGDQKLAPSIGLVLGWHSWAAVPAGLLLGFALTALCAAALTLTGRLKRGDHIAHGPGMLTATLAVTIMG